MVRGAFDNAAPDDLEILVDGDASRTFTAEVANSLGARIVRCSGGVFGFTDGGTSSRVAAWKVLLRFGVSFVKPALVAP